MGTTWYKTDPIKEGWYLVAVFDPVKNKNRAMRCFWRNKPKKVYYKQNGVTKFRYKGQAGWSDQNLKGRPVLAWTYLPDFDLLGLS